MPVTAKLFLALMMAGLTVEIAQFFFYAYVASLNDDATVAAYSTWLAPFREFGLGLLLPAWCWRWPPSRGPWTSSSFASAS
jgi:hypothetical protein